jgi:hypothetical protein
MWRDAQHLDTAGGEINHERGVERDQPVHRPHLGREEIGAAAAGHPAAPDGSGPTDGGSGHRRTSQGQGHSAQKGCRASRL